VTGEFSDRQKEYDVLKVFKPSGHLSGVIVAENQIFFQIQPSSA